MSTATPEPPTIGTARGYRRAKPPLHEIPIAMKRAVIYLRVSTEGQIGTWITGDGLSLSAQEEICRTEAARLEAQVAGVYTEKGKSGSKRASRIALEGMLTDIARDRVDYVIVYKLDRLARNVIDDAMLSHEIERTGARLVSVMEQFDEASAQGWLMHRIYATFAEYEIKQSGQRVSMGMKRKAELGGTPGKPPIGYKTERIMQRGSTRGVSQVIVDDERAGHVRWAFEAYATGDWSVQALVEELDLRGLRSRPHRRDALPRPLRKNELHRVLTNRYYLGKVIYKDVEYDGIHPPLIEQALFDRVQHLLNTRNRSGSRYRIHDHYLKGSIFCGRCAQRFYLFLSKNRHGTIYPYFICRGRQQKSCDMPCLPVETVEAGVERCYQAAELRRDEIDWVRDAIDHEVQRIDADNASVIDSQSRRLDRLADEETKNARAFQADAISLEVLKAERDRIEAERSDARRVIERAQVRYGDVRARIDQVIALLEDVATTYRSADPLLRRALNQAIFERLVVHEDGLDGQLTPQVQILHDAAGQSPTQPQEAETQPAAVRDGGWLAEASLDEGVDKTLLVRARRLKLLASSLARKRSIN